MLCGGAQKNIPACVAAAALSLWSSIKSGASVHAPSRHDGYHAKDGFGEIGLALNLSLCPCSLRSDGLGEYPPSYIIGYDEFAGRRLMELLPQLPACGLPLQIPDLITLAAEYDA